MLSVGTRSYTPRLQTTLPYIQQRPTQDECSLIIGYNITLYVVYFDPIVILSSGHSITLLSTHSSIEAFQIWDNPQKRLLSWYKSLCHWHELPCRRWPFEDFAHQRGGIGGVLSATVSAQRPLGMTQSLPRRVYSWERRLSFSHHGVVPLGVVTREVGCHQRLGQHLVGCKHDYTYTVHTCVHMHVIQALDFFLFFCAPRLKRAITDRPITGSDLK